MKLNEENRRRKENLTGLLKNSTTLTIIVVTGAVLVGVIGLAFARLGQTAEEVPGGASVGGAPSVQHLPGVNDTPTHAALQQQANAQRLQQAQSANRSTLPTPTSGQQVNQPISLPSATNPNAGTDVSTIQFQPVTPPAEVVTPPPTLPQTPVASAALPVQQEVSKGTQDRINSYLELWGPKDLLFQEYTVVNNTEKQWEKPTDMQASASVGASQGPGNAGSRTAANEIRFVRAGTTVPAKLITPLNSDAPGPVLAEITSGPLAGARLIGTMQVAKNSLLVNFSTISKPGWPSTYSVGAVGMSVDRSTALATDVNNHYFQKYTGLLAGSFIEGYGDAMTQQGSVTYLDPTSGGVVRSQDELNGSQISKSAQGEVLSTLGRDWQRQTQNVTPTIKVQGKDGADYPLQILFLKNF